MNQTMQRSLEVRTPAIAPAGPLQLLPFPWSENIKHLLARCERQIISHAIYHAGGVKRRAADLLGISPFALERRLHRVAALLDEPAVEAESAASSSDQLRSEMPDRA